MIAAAIRQIATLLALALMPALVSGAIQLQWRGQPPATGDGDEVTLVTAKNWGDQILWVDARPRASFDREHIPGAILLNEDEWEKLVPGFLDTWEPEKQIVVYCDGGSCDSSKAVASRLRDELKLDHVHVLQGGWDSWLRR